jgi:hypothetical protein
MNTHLCLSLSALAKFLIYQQSRRKGKTVMREKGRGRAKSWGITGHYAIGNRGNESS